MLVVRLSDRHLDVAQGEAGIPATLTSFASLTQLRGSMRDGIVVDPVGFRDAVQPFWKENNLPTDNVKVVLDTPHFMQRTMDAPVFKKPVELEEYLRREILSLGRISNPLFTYDVVGEGSSENTQKVELTIIESQVIERLLESFSKFDVKVTAVTNLANNTAQALVAMGKIRRATGSTLVVTATENKVQSVLEQEGSFRYGSTQQVFNEYASAGFANEITRTVTNTIQFMTAQNLATELNRVRLVGLTPEAEAVCVAAVSSAVDGLDVAPWPLDNYGTVSPELNIENADNALGATFPLLMALAAPENGRKIVSALTGEDDKKLTLPFIGKLPKEAEPLIKALLPTGIALVVCLLATLGVNAWNGAVESDIKTAKTFLATPLAQQQLADYSAAKAKADESAAESTSARTLVNNLAQFPKPDSSVNAILEACADGLTSVTTNSYDSTTGKFTVTVTSDDYSTIHQFVNRVIATNQFDVLYEGYDYAASSTNLGATNTDGHWQLKITLVLPKAKQEG